MNVVLSGNPFFNISLNLLTLCLKKGTIILYSHVYQIRDKNKKEVFG